MSCSWSKGCDRLSHWPTDKLTRWKLREQQGWNSSMEGVRKRESYCVFVLSETRRTINQPTQRSRYWLNSVLITRSIVRSRDLLGWAQSARERSDFSIASTNPHIWYIGYFEWQHAHNSLTRNSSVYYITHTHPLTHTHHHHRHNLWNHIIVAVIVAI